MKALSHPAHADARGQSSGDSQKQRNLFSSENTLLVLYFLNITYFTMAGLFSAVFCNSLFLISSPPLTDNQRGPLIIIFHFMCIFILSLFPSFPHSFSIQRIIICIPNIVNSLTLLFLPFLILSRPSFNAIPLPSPLHLLLPSLLLHPSCSSSGLPHYLSWATLVVWRAAVVKMTEQ